MTGKVHSIETMGTLDGPGIRTVVFLQGCMNRCAFCHNPDVVLDEGGTEYTTEALVAELLKGKAYWQSYETDSTNAVKGGVTFSGGDPLYQPAFLLEVVSSLQKEGVHVVVDTSANAEFGHIEKLFPFVDLWMISLKQMHEELHQELTHVSGKPILENVTKLDEELTKYNQAHPNTPTKKIRIRFVIIPGITDSTEHLELLGKYIATIKNIEAVELLPYSTIGRQKWIELFGKYKLDGIPEATLEDVAKTKKTLERFTSGPYITPEQYPI